MVGSAIFLVPSSIAQSLPSIPMILGAWVVAGALSFLGALAYAELSGTPASVPRDAPLRRLRWADVYRDFDSFVIRRRQGRMGFGTWLASVAGCRSFAYLAWGDLRPGLLRIGSIVVRLLRARLDAPARPSANGSK